MVSQLRPRLDVVRVTGRSMAPTLRDGDLVLVRRRPPRAGALAVVRLPPDADGMPRPLAIKRVTGRDPGDPQRWWVERDNPREGVDSWLVGSLATADILAVAVLRLWPRPGRLPGPPAG
ncbi:S26 family signal peptidase [Nostocoides australiense]|nr:S26 family signal peptidase [Tetrasphaera australiensis]